MNYGIDYSIINSLVENFNNDLKSQSLQDDIAVYIFPQTWGDTSLGYGGFGGQMMTSAQTIVLYAQNENIARVYFGGELLAYEIKNPNKIFFRDLYDQNLEPQYKKGKYLRETQIL